MAATKQNATDIVEASGAIEDHVALAEIDLSHPAVDDKPRANAPADAVRIDFNDPTVSTAEAVEANLAKS